MILFLFQSNLFSRKDHPFYDKHNDLLKAIWTVDRAAKSKEEKLSSIRNAIGSNPPSNLVDILDEKSGEPRAKVPPLIIACFEGDFDVIQFLIEVFSTELSIN